MLYRDLGNPRPAMPTAPETAAKQLQGASAPAAGVPIEQLKHDVPYIRQKHIAFAVFVSVTLFLLMAKRSRGGEGTSMSDREANFPRTAGTPRPPSAAILAAAPAPSQPQFSLPPVLITVSDGCSGSSFLYSFAIRLAEAHARAAGGDPNIVGCCGTSEYLNPRNNPWYRDTNHPMKDGRDMVDGTYMHLVQSKENNDTSKSASTMAVKTLSYQLAFGGVAEALRRLGGRVVLSHRANKLNGLACQIKDCFNQPWHKELGSPVFENGTRARLCYNRRKSPKVVTKAKFGIAAIDAHVRGLMAREPPTNSASSTKKRGKTEGKNQKRKLKEARCRAALGDPNARTTIALAGWDAGYPKLQEETLVAFESNQVGSALFNESMVAWRAWMRGWGIGPRDDIIFAEMERQGIGTRTPSDVTHSVYNVDEMNEMAAGWQRDSKSDHAVCDWSWMTSQQMPPRSSIGSDRRQ